MAGKQYSRGLLGTMFDRLVAWGVGLPPERNNYTVQAVTIPLEGENINLAADLYQPIITTKTSKDGNGGQPAGTLLVMCPYGRRPPLSLTLARVWAARGYVVLFVSVRGTYGSDGAQDPARSDVVDGPLVVRWMRAQPWYTGTFATLGVSYLAYASFALLGAGEPLGDMAAAVCLAGPDDFAEVMWGTGTLWLPLVDWARLAIQPGARKGAKHSLLTDLQGFWRMATMDPDGDVPLKKSVPLLDGVKARFGDEAPWLMKIMENSDFAKDESGLYKPMRHGDIFGKANVPILLVSGWMDIFTTRTLDQFQQLSKRGCPVGLTVGPWCHMDVFGGKGVLKESYDWLEHYLAKSTTTNPVRQAPVRVNVTGTDEWRWLPSWPPATRSLEFYLDTNGRLSERMPATTGQSQFTFNPHDPTPNFGGPLLFGGGYVDDSALAKRSDVLAFTTSPLDHDVEVLGKPHVELVHSSDNPYVDVFLRLCEVNSKGASRNLTQVYKRLDPDRTQPSQSTKVELDLSDCAHHFKKGTSIRLIVAGAAFPHYMFNLGSGEDSVTGSTLRPAGHTVHTGGSGGSRIVLPVSLA